MTDDLHTLAANTIRTLTMDAVEEVGNGHPGMPMGMADVGVVLFRDYLKHNPADPQWPDRDRYVQSAGHGSMLIYSLLHLSGYDLSLEELKNYRQWGSLTPGHPESHLTPGVETTTGPLGQGITNAVGMALAERLLAERFNRPDHPIVDHYTYVIASDGDLMEGISQEASSLAGHLGLSKLIVFYDDNRISIDGSTDLTFTEDVAGRFAAYGWHVQQIDGHDAEAIGTAVESAQAEREQPSIIVTRTHIGFGSPNKQDTASVHGSALGAEEVRRTKENLGWPPDARFRVPEEVYAYMKPQKGGAEAQAAWETRLAAYEEAHPALAAEFRRVMAGDLPAEWDADMPVFEAGEMLATRASSGKTLDGLAPRIPELVGGSADLTGSNKTHPKGIEPIDTHDFAGRYIHFGVREHAMGGMLNGMALHGGLRVYGGTFLVFSDYMRPAIRLAALMELPVTYVFTHDSIGLGEDGPTHQPVEHLMALRAIPNLMVFRPADAREVTAGWRAALLRQKGPTALVLTRQKVPTLAESLPDGALRGAYVLRDSDQPAVLLLATGSEVQLAVDAYDWLAEEGIQARVVSMPSFELFEAQDAGYRQSVLPEHIQARVAVEAGVPHGWERYVGRAGAIIGLDHFGASADYKTLYREFGITVDAVVEAARRQVVPAEDG